MTEFLYGEKVKSAVDCFDNKMEQLETKYRDFLEENEIDFKLSYILQFSSNSASFNVTDKLVSDKMGHEIEKAFYGCFATLSESKS